MKSNLPNQVLIGNDTNDKRIVHDSGLVVRTAPPYDSAIVEYYPGGATEEQRLGWGMITLNRAPTLQEVAIFNVAVSQAKIATSLIS